MHVSYMFFLYLSVVEMKIAEKINALDDFEEIVDLEKGGKGQPA